jgi:hypothetical protein
MGACWKPPLAGLRRFYATGSPMIGGALDADRSMETTGMKQ